jgi:hypothetical protein
LSFGASVFLHLRSNILDNFSCPRFRVVSGQGYRRAVRGRAGNMFCSCSASKVISFLPVWKQPFKARQMPPTASTFVRDIAEIYWVIGWVRCERLGSFARIEKRTKVA